MNIATAIEILTKEQELQSIGLLELLIDIRENREIYSPTLLAAYRVFMAKGSELFA